MKKKVEPKFRPPKAGSRGEPNSEPKREPNKGAELGSLNDFATKVVAQIQFV